MADHQQPPCRPCPNRRPWQSRDKTWPSSQQWNARPSQRNTFITEGTYSEGANDAHAGHCTYCGETNHRSHVCRFGMPVNCFRCHRQGHKEKFCDYYPWRAGKEGCQRKTFECNLNNVQPSKNYDNTNTDNVLLDGSLNTKHRGFIKTLAVPPKCDKLVNDCKALKPPICEKSLDEISFWNNYLE